MSTLRVQEVSQTFVRPDGSKHDVLKNIDLTVAEGQIVTVVGASGCGKSTLLNIMAGLIQPSIGTVTLDGVPQSGPGPERGMVFQQDTLFGWRSVVRNVEYGLEVRRMPKKERRVTALTWLERVGLRDYADYLPKQLSGGMKKRAQIASVLANDPDVLLMDEPYGALDYPTKCRLQDDLLKALALAPKTTIFVTHDLEEAVYLGDRVLVMSGGEIVEDLAVELARPRGEVVRNSPELALLKAHIWGKIGYGQTAKAPA